MVSKATASPKKLVIAEKPSVARDLAKALGGFKANKSGFLEREDMLISSAVGHLAELFMPGDWDAKYRYWSLKNLPIFLKTEGLRQRWEGNWVLILMLLVANWG